MKIGLRAHNAAEDRLLFAHQIDAQGVSIWASVIERYDERCYLIAEVYGGLSRRRRW